MIYREEQEQEGLEQESPVLEIATASASASTPIRIKSTGKRKNTASKAASSMKKRSGYRKDW